MLTGREGLHVYGSGMYSTLPFLPTYYYPQTISAYHWKQNRRLPPLPSNINDVFEDVSEDG